jgi:DNA-directed RNA polymerase, mitochondrial
MNLTSELRVESQLKLETECLDLGITKYREALAADGTGDLPPGQQLIKAAMRPLIEALVEWLAETGKGLASRNAGVYHFVNTLTPEAVAWITASVAISILHQRPSVQDVAVAIALRMEQAINIDAIIAANPALGAKVTKRIRAMNAEHNRLVFIRRGLEMVDVKVIQWDNTVRVRVGTLLVQMFAQSTGLVSVDVVTQARRSTTVVRPSESCRRWLEESHARCELLSPVRMPMVCYPHQWTNPFNGGYLTKELRQPLVKTRNRGYLTQLKEWDMPWVYASVNALQDTAWSVNEVVYGILKELWQSERTVGGLPAREDLPLPARSFTEGDPTVDPAVLHAWKVDAAKTYELNARTVSKRLQLVQKLWSAEKLIEYGNVFHFVYNLDWRGRIYPVASSLSPQGDDSAKALLRFARGVPLGGDGAYWLAIHGANSFGVDKVSFEDRIQWVEDHTDQIIESANHPTTGTMWWCEADAPFTFLAFCFEYAKLQRWLDGGNEQETFESHIAVAFDGACNGLQNFSAMLRDPVGGKATGLVPGERPADIYTQVKDAAQRIIDADAAGGNEVAQRWVGKMTRKLAKRNTMTVPYGVTLRGMRDQLYAELTDSAPENRGADADYLAKCNHEAISQVVVAARLAMDWLRGAAKVAASNGLPVSWKTPAGFLAVQDYREAEGDIIDFTVLGRRFKLVVQKDGDKLSPRKQALGISPNFVHSLDAAHLMRTVLFCKADGIDDFAMIHDSYGCHAGHASLLRDNLRQAFVDQYSQPVLAQFRDELLWQLPPELVGELPELPPMGDLDLEQVKHSDYFFA